MFEKLDFYNCLRLIQCCVENSILMQSPTDRNQILVLIGSDDETWYSVNIHEAARELTTDVEGQTALLNALKIKGIKFTIEFY